MVNGSWGPGDLPVVRWRIEIDNIQAGLEEVYTGNKGLSLDAVFVQIVRVSVGGGDKDCAMGHENL
jgi:hypothetical protein